MADADDKDKKDADDLFTEGDVAGDAGDAGAGEGDLEAEGDPAESGLGDDAGDSKAALISEASAEAAELGIMVPDDATDFEEWIEHFVTAVKTHKSTKANGADTSADAGAGDAAGGADANATPVEEPMTTVSMSMVETLKKDLEAEKQTTSRLSKVAANALLKDTLGRVDALARTGVVTRARVEGWKQILESKQMSLLTGKDAAIRKVITEIAFAEEMAKDGGANLLKNRTDMSHASGEATPPWYFDEAKEAEKKKEQEELTKTMIAMAEGRRV